MSSMSNEDAEFFRAQMDHMLTEARKTHPSVVPVIIEVTQEEADALGARQWPALWKVKELARVLGMTPQTMYSWIAQGKVTHLRTPGGRLRIPADEVERLVSLVVGEIPDSPLT